MRKCSTTPSMLSVNGARTRLRKWQNSHERGLLSSSRLLSVAEARLSGLHVNVLLDFSPWF
jgi:hypothetical protein